MSRIALNSIQSEKILISGAAGLLGRQLIYELLKRGVRPICLVRENSDTAYIDAHNLEKRHADLVQEDALAEALIGIDRVIHTAAIVNFRGDQRTRFARINAFAAERFFKLAQQAQVKRFVQVSSIVGIGATPLGGEPINEQVEYALEDVHVPYVETKHQAEELLFRAEKSPEFNTELIVVNPSIMVAPSRHGSDKQRIERLMSRAILPRLPNRLNLVDLRDVAEAIVNALIAGESCSRYLLTGENISIDNLLNSLAEFTGSSPRRIQPPGWALQLVAKYQVRRHKRRGGKLRIYPELLKLLEYDWVYDNTKAKRELAFTARPLDQTLRELYQGDFAGTFLDVQVK
jgi:dihydroflavonol-4-reductase